jgi:hypothetical protein
LNVHLFEDIKYLDFAIVIVVLFNIDIVNNFFKELLYGDIHVFSESRPYYKQQRKNFRKVWRNNPYQAFGIERLVRIILQIVAFFAPSGIIKWLTGRSHLLTRRIGIEIYAIGKIFFAWKAVNENWTTNGFVTWLIIILAIDTLHALLSRIFLNDLWREEISYKRNLTMAFINYMEICMCFAAIYNFEDFSQKEGTPVFIIQNEQAAGHHLTPSQVIYFSFITSATVGYGDIYPKDSFVQKLVVTQIMVSLFLVLVVITNIGGKIGYDTFLNKKNTEP